MGRISLAQKFMNELDFPDNSEDTWMVLYDFLGTKPSPNFWANLNRVQDMLDDTSLSQYSLFRTNSLKGAAVAERLVKHYGGKTLVFRGEEVELDQVIGPFDCFRIHGDEVYYILRSLAIDLNQMLTGRKPRKDIENLNRFIVRSIVGEEISQDRDSMEETRKVGIELQRILKEDDPDSYQGKIAWLHKEEITPVLSRAEETLRSSSSPGETRQNKALFSVLWKLINFNEKMPEVTKVTIEELVSEQPSHLYKEKTDKNSSH
jgi:hypothetical protein